jgi:hypothetical protein
MRIRLAAALALVFVLAACGGGGDTSKATSSDRPTPKVAMDGSLPRVPEGRPVPAALTEFVCARDDKGIWTASGAVVNDTKKSASFQVTAHVGPSDGQGAAARTKRIAAVQAHGSVRFDLGKIESRSDEGPCHVQVLALAS